MVPARPGQLDFRKHPFGPRALTNGPANYQHQQQIRMMMLQAGVNLARLTTGSGGSYDNGPDSPAIDITYPLHVRPLRPPSPSEHGDGGSAVLAFPTGGMTTSHEQLLRQPTTESSPGEPLCAIGSQIR